MISRRVKYVLIDNKGVWSLFCAESIDEVIANIVENAASLNWVHGKDLKTVVHTLLCEGSQTSFTLLNDASPSLNEFIKTFANTKKRIALCGSLDLTKICKTGLSFVKYLYTNHFKVYAAIVDEIFASERFSLLVKCTSDVRKADKSTCEHDCALDELKTEITSLRNADFSDTRIGIALAKFIRSSFWTQWFTDVLDHQRRDGALNDGRTLEKYLEGIKEFRTAASPIGKILKNNGILDLDLWAHQAEVQNVAYFDMCGGDVYFTDGKNWYWYTSGFECPIGVAYGHITHVLDKICGQLESKPRRYFKMTGASRDEIISKFAYHSALWRVYHWFTKAIDKRFTADERMYFVKSIDAISSISTSDIVDFVVLQYSEKDDCFSMVEFDLSGTPVEKGGTSRKLLVSLAKLREREAQCELREIMTA